MVTDWPFAPFTTPDRHTYEDVHLAIEIVVDDQVVRQFEAMRLHRVARAIVEVPLVGCTITQENKRIQLGCRTASQTHIHAFVRLHVCVHA